MISYKYRFHGHNSLRYVYKNGTQKRNQYLAVKYTINTHRNTSRFAVVVAKKVHKSAVGRNRIRRRIYEWFRIHQTSLNNTYDIVCTVSSAEIRTMDAGALNDLLSKLLHQLLASPVEK